MADTSDIENAAEESRRYALPERLVERVGKALEEERHEIVRRLVAPLPPVELAELLDQLEGDQRRALTALLGDALDPQVLIEVAPELREEMLEQLGVEQSAAAIARLDADEAVYVIEDLDAEDQKEILAAIPEETRADLAELLAYPDSSAGRLMRKKYVAVPEFWTVGDTIDHLRSAQGLPAEFYEIFVVDPYFRPMGTVLASQVMRSQRSTPMSEIMSGDDLKTFAADTDQEELARIFQKYGLVEAPVVSQSGRLLGVITVHDIVDVISEEAEEDILHLGGVREGDFYSDFARTVKLRFPWLGVNLLTALVSSSVIGMFEEVFAQLVVLAVLMPIVASMGGNAGVQTVTVAVRALAMRELTRNNLRRSIGKEMLVGLANGVLFALVTGAATGLWFQNPALGLVFGGAVLTTLFAAGLAGVCIPLIAQKLGADPAVTSTVFLTMVTDVVGFFSFLGLATLILLR